MDSSAYGIVHFFPEGTKEQYEAAIAAVHPGEGRMPAGADFPCRRGIPGWMDGHGGPRIERELGTVPGQYSYAAVPRGHPGGFTSMPEETVVDLYKLLPLGGSAVRDPPQGVPLALDPHPPGGNCRTCRYG